MHNTFEVLGSIALASAALAIANAAIAQDAGSLLTRYRIEVSAAGQERVELEEIRDQTIEILASNRFRDNLLALRNPQDSVVYAVTGPKSEPLFMTFAKLASIVRLEDPGTEKFRTYLTLAGTYYNPGERFTGKCANAAGKILPCYRYEFDQNRMNEDVVTRGVTLGNDTILDSVIGRKIHERYRSDSLTRKSCALNTVAHEILHAIGERNSTAWHEDYFVDTVVEDVRVGPTEYPQATYLVGTVAQCTWLQDRDAIGDDAAALKACVRRYGTNSFNSSQCT